MEPTEKLWVLNYKLVYHKGKNEIFNKLYGLKYALLNNIYQKVNVTRNKSKFAMIQFLFFSFFFVGKLKI